MDSIYSFQKKPIQTDNHCTTLPIVKRIKCSKLSIKLAK